jgi:hypothetical protein
MLRMGRFCLPAFIRAGVSGGDFQFAIGKIGVVIWVVLVEFYLGAGIVAPCFFAAAVTACKNKFPEIWDKDRGGVERFIEI